MKNNILTALAGTAILAFSINAQNRASDLKDEALNVQQNSSSFAIDVYAIDSESGEQIMRAGLGHRVHYSDDVANNAPRPRVGRVYDAVRGCTRITGDVHKPVTFKISAGDYEAAEFEIVPDSFTSQQTVMMVELVRKADAPAPHEGQALTQVVGR